jgi:hypothetical protein
MSGKFGPYRRAEMGKSNSGVGVFLLGVGVDFLIRNRVGVELPSPGVELELALFPNSD